MKISSFYKGSASSKSLKTNPRVEKRRRLNLERRNKKLIQLWRFFLFSGITYGLGLLVINKGWSAIDVSQIHVKGSPKIQPKEIVIASGMNFPKPLFLINQNQLKSNLIKDLPIKSIQIRRRLIPPSLEIDLKERKPIAFASRRTSKGKEKGMLDQDGYWMPISMATKTKPPLKEIYVEGWMDIHRNWISIILDNEKNLGSPLMKIIVNPNGELSLQTKDFEMIYLGANSFKINQQINALNQLSKNLPSSFRNQTGTVLDIRDPSKPELQMPNNKFKGNSSN